MLDDTAFFVLAVDAGLDVARFGFVEQNKGGDKEESDRAQSR